MRRIVLLAGLLAGCATLAPSPTQLERMKTRADQGDRAANASESIACTGGEVCGQLHLLKGDACYGQARQNPATRRDHLACASSELAAGLALHTSEQSVIGARAEYARKRLEVLHMQIDSKRGGEASAAPELASAASDYRTRYPGDPAGPYYLASARLTMAQDRFLTDHNGPALCGALSEVATLQQGAMAAPGDFAPNLRELGADVQRMKRPGGCA